MPKLRVTIIDEVRNRRLKVDLPDDAAMEKLLPALAKKLGLPATDPGGQPIAYQLTHEATRRALGGDQTLASFGVREGDALRLAAAREEAPVVPWPAEEAGTLWEKVPVWGWVGIVVVVAVLAFLIGQGVKKPVPTPTVVIEVTTPAVTSTAISRPTATLVVPTFTPLPPTDTPVPPTAPPVPPTDTPVPPTPTPVPVQPSPTPECVTAYARSVVLFKQGFPIYTEAPIQNLLGPPQEGHWTTVSGSVGHNGSVVVDFGGRLIQDGPGPDLIFWFGGYPYPDEPEIIEGFKIEGSLDGQSFELIAEVPPKSKIPAPSPLTPEEVDLQGKGNLRYLRITDTGTDPDFAGLELNAIEATCTSTGE